MLLPKQTKAPVRIKVPLDISEEVGLGDAVKRLTSRVGITPCAPCEARAAALNRYIAFTGRSGPHR